MNFISWKIASYKFQPPRQPPLSIEKFIYTLIFVITVSIDHLLGTQTSSEKEYEAKVENYFLPLFIISIICCYKAVSDW
jgi:hypothetical protein